MGLDATEWIRSQGSEEAPSGPLKCIRGQKSAQLRNVTRTGQEGAAFDVGREPKKKPPSLGGNSSRMS